jgi:hypothetical protein
VFTGPHLVSLESLLLGTQRVNVTATGIDVTGTGIFSGGISGGTFT